MGQFTIPQAAAVQAQPQLQPLNNDERVQWNGFLDYLNKKGVQGSPMLDNRNTALGQQLMEEYRAQNPHFSLNYNQVPQVQNDLQNYRQGLVKQWQSNPKVAPGVKSADDIMGGISPVDGWLGSKTSSYRYPVAALNNQNFGTDVAKYDAAIAALKKQ